MTRSKRARLAYPQALSIWHHRLNQNAASNRARIAVVHAASMTNRPAAKASGVLLTDPRLGAARPVGAEGVAYADSPSCRSTIEPGEADDTPSP